MPKPHWKPPDEIPDSEITVLLRLKDEDDPIWPGFHDGLDWRAADGARLLSGVLGWMHIDVAAQLLDGRQPA